MSRESSQPRRQWLRPLLVLSGVLSILSGSCALLLWFGLCDLCRNGNLVEVPSPNGRLKAVIFRRDCGATTGYSTQVSILRASHNLPNEAGNVFVADNEHPVTVRWLDDHHLVIAGGTKTQFPRLTEYEGVSITYQ